MTAFKVGDIISVPMKIRDISLRGAYIAVCVDDPDSVKVHINSKTLRVNSGGNERDYGPATLLCRPEPPAYFSEARVGEDVWAVACGDGMITKTVSASGRPDLTVQFRTYLDCPTTRRYSLNGKSFYDEKLNQTLFYLHDSRVFKIKGLLAETSQP